MLQVSNLGKTLQGQRVLDGIGFQIAKGEVVALLGPSGGGKSTLLRCLVGLTTPDQGTLHRAIHPKTGKPIQMGLVFQQFHLFDHLNALCNVAIALEIVQKLPKPEAENKAAEALARIGVGALATRYPRELSGGQQQRVAIARALAMEPQLLLFDEPTSALDPGRVQEVVQLLRTLNQQDMTLLVVTHEVSFARNVAGRILFIDHGKIVADKPTLDFFQAPFHPAVADYLEHYSG